jgi:hypothetical protein
MQIIINALKEIYWLIEWEREREREEEKKEMGEGKPVRLGGDISPHLHLCLNEEREPTIWWSGEEGEWRRKQQRQKPW